MTGEDAAVIPPNGGTPHKLFIPFLAGILPQPPEIFGFHAARGGVRLRPLPDIAALSGSCLITRPRVKVLLMRNAFSHAVPITEKRVGPTTAR